MENEKKKRNLRVSCNSPVILGFVGICLAALILSIITNGISNRMFFTCYRSSFLNPMTYVRLIGHVFGHSGWSHLINNMTMILVIGPMLEEKYGHSDIIIVIISTAVITGLVHMLFFPTTGLLGASGVVFAFILMSSFASVREGTIPLTFILVAVLYLGEQVIDGIFIRDNISNLTHIIGGITGAAFGYIANTKAKS